MDESTTPGADAPETNPEGGAGETPAAPGMDTPAEGGEGAAE